MDRDYGMEIEGLKKEMEEIRGLLQAFERGRSGSAGSAKEADACRFVGDVEVVSGMHPDKELSKQMEELCQLAGERGVSGLINYMGVFASGGRQSCWIKKHMDVESQLLPLVENHMAEKVLRCIGNGDRLSILLAVLQKPRTVAELVTVCGLNSTGQAYHHMKPLLAADLLAEDDSDPARKGVYIVRPHKVQGIVMLLAGIADMVDETYTAGNWEGM
ncbi:MAG: helix-turn-helix domain-containing protein [Lachnospiraceae bacterium]|nr:helix-turn-helix domain-containing protein [Lachnospiraceae bacterium]